MKPSLKVILFSILLISPGWGFFGHQKINRLAVFMLPTEMIGFYKKNINYLAEASTYPDRRRYAVPEEAPRHYMDVEEYGDSVWTVVPKYWNQAVKKYSEDTLKLHGIVPWHIVRMFNQLKDAFMMNDPDKILRCSAELAHYIGDANVPLHSTRNHNGQLTNQHGIHGLWESRLPELFFESYDFYVGKASYIADPQEAAWDAVKRAHSMVDSVLREEKILSENSPVKFNYETKGKQTVKVYSATFSKHYHEKLNGMVERQFRASIKMAGDFWFTAWVDAGQPDLKKLINYRPSQEELQKNRDDLFIWKQQRYKAREHDGDSVNVGH
ncbi:hypothetical protein BH09BAC3_BH09BAC3_31400 [soil metagenome]